MLSLTPHLRRVFPKSDFCRFLLKRIQYSIFLILHNFRCLAKIFNKYFCNVIKKHNFTLHDLRHSYATHLLDMGVDLGYIQELPAHKSSRTTEIYTHVSIRNLKNIKNPLDTFEV
ncbi:MAG: tyrosine-type recombinase/integrase [Chlorobi bacterium]|nr:tyrosine-type recombinase/integrase [Chlorobiota bacterium]